MISNTLSQPTDIQRGDLGIASWISAELIHPTGIFRKDKHLAPWEI